MPTSRSAKVAAKKNPTKLLTKKTAPTTPPPRILVVGGYPGASAYGVVCALAIDAQREIQRVELSALVSRYAKETERNLDKLFQHAEANEVILFFDEADALFGKRSEVRDSHDRYANIEVSYLLERLDRFPGMVVFASNRPSNLDDTLFRRCQQVVSIEPPPPPRKKRT
jgi:SpoVK/Ycf46/Vps4 family AAA+-type ATPase